MFILIRQNVKIKGIKLNEVEALLSQFADDTTSFSSENSINKNKTNKQKTHTCTNRN
jgi:hypothetical protein